MSIATELQELNDNILDAYSAIQTKGGTVPTHKNTANLDTAIASIPGGSGPEAYIPLEVSGQGVLRRPSVSYSWAPPNSATRIGTYVLYYAFMYDNSITSIDLNRVMLVDAFAMYYACWSCTGLQTANLSSVISVQSSSFENAFYGCTSLTTVDLSGLTAVGTYAFSNAFNGCSSLSSLSIGGANFMAQNNSFRYAFRGCVSLTSVDLSKVTIMHDYSFQYAFQSCTGLASVNLSNLTQAKTSALGQAFSGCINLTSVNLSSLATISNQKVLQKAFENCTSLTTLSFPALTASSFGSYTNQFNSMLSGCTGVTVHFPSAIQSTIGNWSDVTAGFGGTNTTVLFDL